MYFSVQIFVISSVHSPARVSSPSSCTRAALQRTVPSLRAILTCTDARPHSAHLYTLLQHRHPIWVVPLLYTPSGTAYQSISVCQVINTRCCRWQSQVSLVSQSPNPRNIAGLSKNGSMKNIQTTKTLLISNLPYCPPLVCIMLSFELKVNKYCLLCLSALIVYRNILFFEKWYMACLCTIESTKYAESTPIIQLVSFI